MFSDDEAEAEYYARKRAKNRGAPFQNQEKLGEKAFAKTKRFRTASFLSQTLNSQFIPKPNERSNER